MQPVKLQKICSFSFILDMTNFLSRKPKQKVEYELFSAVIHVGGSTSGGHYHVFIKDLYGTICSQSANDLNANHKHHNPLDSTLTATYRIKLDSKNPGKKPFITHDHFALNNHLFAYIDNNTNVSDADMNLNKDKNQLVIGDDDKNVDSDVDDKNDKEDEKMNDEGKVNDTENSLDKQYLQTNLHDSLESLQSIHLNEKSSLSEISLSINKKGKQKLSINTFDHNGITTFNEENEKLCKDIFHRKINKKEMEQNYLKNLYKNENDFKYLQISNLDQSSFKSVHEEISNNAIGSNLFDRLKPTLNNNQEKLSTISNYSKLMNNKDYVTVDTSLQNRYQQVYHRSKSNHYKQIVEETPNSSNKSLLDVREPIIYLDGISVHPSLIKPINNNNKKSVNRMNSLRHSTIRMRSISPQRKVDKSMSKFSYSNPYKTQLSQHNNTLTNRINSADNRNAKVTNQIYEPMTNETATRIQISFNANEFRRCSLHSSINSMRWKSRLFNVSKMDEKLKSRYSLTEDYLNHCEINDFLARVSQNKSSPSYHCELMNTVNDSLEYNSTYLPNIKRTKAKMAS
ncbi:unnamed protein product [Heterobilharzia americana]|nr:unnamed protein product [Heterobilharzia americana]